MKILESKSLSYDDVNLIARPQKLISSRKEVLVQTWRVIVSPMESVVGYNFACEALKLGLQVCIPRFRPIEERINLYKKLKHYDQFDNLWFCLGLSKNELLLAKNELGRIKVLVDVANGYLNSVVKYTEECSNAFSSIGVGNVHTSEGFLLYSHIPNVRFIRVGIGGSKVCGTGHVTGYTRGQITEIKECANFQNVYDHSVCADGGIDTCGKMVKAFAAGSQLVMMGSYFSLAEEAENVIRGEYKYWGGASHYQQAKYKKSEDFRHSEGYVKELDKNNIKPLKEILNELWGGLSSAISYSGYDSIDSFIGNGVFEEKV